MNIVILTGDHYITDPEKPNAQYSKEDLRLHQRMVDAFESIGNHNIAIINDHRLFFEKINETTKPNLVVNFCDTGFKNNVKLEPSIPAYLEMIGVPYTGSPAEAIVACYDKSSVRYIAQSLGINVPKELYIESSSEVPWSELSYPSLIKPNKSDGSFGITKDAVVRDRDAAEKYINWLRDTLKGRDFLIQEYLPGTEYSVGLVGNPTTGMNALPVLEVDYSALPSQLSPILSYESKTDPESPYWTDIKYRKADISDDECNKLIGASRKLFERLCLRDYGRFDFRRDEAGTLRLMEVNPNPAWDEGAKLALMTGFQGLPYEALLTKILDSALQRYGIVR